VGRQSKNSRDFARRDRERVFGRHCEERKRRPRPSKLNERRRKQSIFFLGATMDCFVAMLLAMMIVEANWLS